MLVLFSREGSYATRARDWPVSRSGRIAPLAAKQEDHVMNRRDAKSGQLLRCSRRAMATLFELLLPPEIASGATIANEALDLIDQLEEQLTVYRDDSEMSRINVRAANEAVEVEKRLFDLLMSAE